MAISAILFLVCSLLVTAKITSASEPPPVAAPRMETAPAGTFEAAKLIKIEVVKDGVAIRDRPSSKGKILETGFFDELENAYTMLYAEPKPIDNEGASWNRALFLNARQVRYQYNVPYVYVNVKDIRRVPFTNGEVSDNDLGSYGERDFLERFDQGRPPRVHIGDDLVKIKKAFGEEDTPFNGLGYRIAKTKVRTRLYRMPDKNAQAFALPAGTAVIDLIPWDRHAGSCAWNFYLSPPFGHHYDMKDHAWFTIIDAKSRKMVGWLDSDDYDFGTSANPSIGKKRLLPSPSMPDMSTNAPKVFVY